MDTKFITCHETYYTLFKSFRADLHLWAEFGPSCAVKYSSVVNRTLLCSQGKSTSQYNHSYAHNLYASDIEIRPLKHYVLLRY